MTPGDEQARRLEWIRSRYERWCDDSTNAHAQSFMLVDAPALLEEADRLVAARDSWRATAEVLQDTEAMADILADAEARVADLERALRGWEIRDEDGEPPCSIQRNVPSLQTLVEGISQEQADAIESFIEYLRSLAREAVVPSPEQREEQGLGDAAEPRQVVPPASSEDATR